MTMLIIVVFSCLNSSIYWEIVVSFKFGIFYHSMQRSQIDNYTRDGGEKIFIKIHCIPSLLAPKNNGILLCKQAPFDTSEENCY